ncbi:MAG: cytochrome c [Betaproteobacteria bacterium]|nr:cytochrome c [Betaproteobacteria bacterium]
MKSFITALLIAGVLVASAFVFVYAGIFNVAADAPHSAFTYTIMETVRSRSIAVRTKDVQPPPLDDAKLIETGAEHYAAMCGGCHLEPGKKDSEIRAGLYPQPPDLTKHLHASPAQEFWVIKHGIKMSGMPAWGLTHDDASIWGLVAFLQKLPDLTPAQYQALAKIEEESHHQHSHDHHDHTGASKNSHHTEGTQKGEHHHHEQ